MLEINKLDRAIPTSLSSKEVSFQIPDAQLIDVRLDLNELKVNHD